VQEKRHISTFGDDLLSNRIVLSASYQAQIDVILPSRHKAVYDDDGFVRVLVHADEDPLPRRTVHVHGETLREGIDDDDLPLLLSPLLLLVILIVRLQTERRERRFDGISRGGEGDGGGEDEGDGYGGDFAHGEGERPWSEGVPFCGSGVCGVHRGRCRTVVTRLGVLALTWP
jgi:hypothetical protein